MAARAQNRAAKRHGRRRTARRLVHHDDARVGDKLDGDRQALALLDGQACFLLSRAIGCVVAVVVRLLGALGVAVCCLDGTAPPPPLSLGAAGPLFKAAAPPGVPLSLPISLPPLTEAAGAADEARPQAGQVDFSQDALHDGLHLAVRRARGQPQARAGPQRLLDGRGGAVDVGLLTIPVYFVNSSF